LHPKAADAAGRRIKMKKRIFALIMGVILITAALTSCGDKAAPPTSEPPPAPSEPLADDDYLVWAVEPTLEYEEISYFQGLDQYIGYNYTPEHGMFILDPKTGGKIGETGPSGGFGNPYEFGYHAETDSFYRYDGYDLVSVEFAEVNGRSKDLVLGIFEEEPNGWAIFSNGYFKSGFDYDRVIGGNAIAFVMQDGKYAIADIDGALQTEFIYDDVSVTSHGFCGVSIDGSWGIVDNSGGELIPFVFEDIIVINENIAFAKFNGKYGILDVGGTLQ